MGFIMPVATVLKLGENHFTVNVNSISEARRADANEEGDDEVSHN
jgi:hypothetical protein